MTTDLDRLIEAVEAGEGNRNDGTLYRLFGDSWVHAWDVMDRDSLDAAVTLLEALLPGRNWSLDAGGGDVVRPYAVVRSGERTWSANLGAEASSPARALLLATLLAYRSTREGG